MIKPFQRWGTALAGAASLCAALWAAPAMAQTTPIKVGGSLEFIAFDGQGRGYLNIEDKNELVVIDTSETKDDLLVFINPEILWSSDEREVYDEGCLSVPGLRGQVPRWTHIRYTGFDQYGDAIDRTVEGFHARVVQHECDHLIGKLYPMRIRDLSQFGYTEVLFPGLDPADD